MRIGQRVVFIPKVGIEHTGVFDDDSREVLKGFVVEVFARPLEPEYAGDFLVEFDQGGDMQFSVLGESSYVEDDFGKLYELTYEELCDA